MSDIRFNRWLHQSGTGGVYQDSSGNIGIGTTTPLSQLDVVGVVSATSFTGNLTGTASTATAAATAYGLSGSPTLTGITSISTTNLTVNGNAYPATGPLSNRNLIINGGFQVDQRNSGTAVTPATTGSTYTVDRFRVFQSVASTLTVQQQTAVVPAGFTHAVEIELAAVRTPTAAQQFFFGTSFEANNIGRLGFGAAGAVATILSFWVRASVTGTYSVSWTNNAGDRSYIGTYTINSADTWEPKTVTFTGDTTGTWVNSGTGRHSFLSWDLGAGSDYDGTADTWQAGNLRKTAASVDFVSGTVADTFYLAGVQLEVGSVATPFEHRSYGQELALCQRYYKQILALQGRQNQSFFMSNYGNTNAVNIIETGLYNMRASVNVSLGPTGNTGNVQYYSYSGTWTSSTLTVSTIGLYPYQQIYLYATADGDGRGKLLRRSGVSDPDIYVEINAEL